MGLKSVRREFFQILSVSFVFSASSLVVCAQEPPALKAARQLEAAIEGRTFQGKQVRPVISTLVFSPDSKELFAGGQGYCILDVAGGRSVFVPTPLDPKTGRPGAAVYDVAYSKDGKVRFAKVGTPAGRSSRMPGRFSVWKVGNKSPSEVEFGTIDPRLIGPAGAVATPPDIVVFSPDGKTVLATPVIDFTREVTPALKSLRNLFHLYNAKRGGAEIRTFRGHTAPVTSLAVSADGKHVVSGAADNSVRLWSIASVKTLRVFKGHTSQVIALACSPDGKLIASAGGAFPREKGKKVDGDYAIRVWDAKTGKELCQFAGHKFGVKSIAFTPDSKRILSLSPNPVSVAGYLWDAATGKEVAILRAPFASAAAISPDGRLVATTSSSSQGIVQLWELP
jgi:WD40 repeat protein